MCNDTPTVGCPVKLTAPISTLGPARHQVKRPRLVTSVLLIELLCRCAWLAWLQQRVFPRSCVTPEGNSCDVLEFGTLCGMLLEMILSMLFLVKFGRWEDQGHFITLWQVVSCAMIWVAKKSLFVYPALMFVAVSTLIGTYLIGLLTELTAASPERLPPFPPKHADKYRPQYGWLGPGVASAVQWKPARWLITILVFATWPTRILIVTYIIFVQPDDLPEYYHGHALAGEGPHVAHLFWVAIFFSIAMFLPELIAEFVCFPEFLKDFRATKPAARAYKTGPYEVCLLEDDAKENSELKQRLRTHECGAITVVIPAYMPNEEDIVLDVLDYYRAQEAEYPGEMRVLLVWNSPQEHPQIEAQLNRLKAEWPSLEVRRNLLSTSKCDNLNLACELLKTDMALLNDMDTIVSAASMCRASLHIHEEGYDVAQAVNTHCEMDYTGYNEEGRFCYGAVITAFDASKPLNQTSQGLWGHAPFNGRGGVWRTRALKAVGFDHRTVGEDHDAAYRAFTYFGFTGILDPNMLCQEREPPTCAGLTSQRIRWETAGLELRRVLPWMLRSKYYTRLEVFVSFWSSLMWGNANMPLQMLPFQLCMIVPFGMVRSYFLMHVLGGKHATIASMWRDCAGQDCLGVSKVHWPWGGEEIVAAPLAVVIFAVLLSVIVLTCLVDHIFRCATTRYRPILPWAVFNFFAKQIMVIPYIFYLQFRALHDYMWGSAKFIPTPRSSSSGSLNSKASLTGLAESDEAGGTCKLGPCNKCPRALSIFTRPLISMHARLVSARQGGTQDGPRAPLLSVEV